MNSTIVLGHPVIGFRKSAQLDFELFIRLAQLQCLSLSVYQLIVHLLDVGGRQSKVLL